MKSFINNSVKPLNWAYYKTKTTDKNWPHYQDGTQPDHQQT
jgi:hypothetical protein